MKTRLVKGSDIQVGMVVWNALFGGQKFTVVKVVVSPTGYTTLIDAYGSRVAASGTHLWEVFC